MIRCYICHNCHYQLGPFREFVRDDQPVFCPKCHFFMARDKAVESAYKNDNTEDDE